MITIVRVNENGQVEAEFDDLSLLNDLLASCSLASTHCLRFIDPYGDTVFNRLQLPVLARELRAATVPPGMQERVELLAAFVDSAAAKVHTYIKFIGD